MKPFDGASATSMPLRLGLATLCGRRQNTVVGGVDAVMCSRVSPCIAQLAAAGLAGRWS